jgi:hypothetical protein
MPRRGSGRPRRWFRFLPRRAGGMQHQPAGLHAVCHEHAGFGADRGGQAPVSARGLDEFLMCPWSCPFIAGPRPAPREGSFGLSIAAMNR